MAMAILATKLFVPPPRAQAIQHHRLTAKLDEGVRAGRKLTLISAPAGLGKTTLLSEWIAAPSCDRLLSRSLRFPPPSTS